MVRMIYLYVILYLFVIFVLKINLPLYFSGFPQSINFKESVIGPSDDSSTADDFDKNPLWIFNDNNGKSFLNDNT